MSDLQSRHQQLVEESDNLKQVQDVLNQELDRTKKELEQALYRPPTAEVEVKTDDVQPEIMIVEQPPSQETLTEIADQIRAEMVLMPRASAPSYLLIGHASIRMQNLSM
jgi:hypothetical protein